MSVPKDGRRPLNTSGPRLTIRGRNPDGSLNLKVDVPGVVTNTFTLSRGPDMRPLQFEGEIIAEAEKDSGKGSAAYRAAIYRTRGGKFVSEFSTVDAACTRSGKADVFGTLDEACDWFRPGPLTTELLKRLGRWGPEIIE
jgi:hypothetical protein